MNDEFEQVNLKMLIAISTAKDAPEKIGGNIKLEHQGRLSTVFIGLARDDFRNGGISLVKQKWSFFVRETTGMEL